MKFECHTMKFGEHEYELFASAVEVEPEYFMEKQFKDYFEEIWDALNNSFKPEELHAVCFMVTDNDDNTDIANLLIENSEEYSKDKTFEEFKQDIIWNLERNGYIAI